MDRLTRFLYPYLSPHIWLGLPKRIRKLREEGRIEDWVEYAFDSPFTPMQVRAEITEFIEIVADRRPRAVLEIGTDAGGTLLLLTLAAAPDAVIISIDLRWRQVGSPWYYPRFAVQPQQMHLLRANSHAPDSLARVRAILLDRPLDMLFIDGDHTYEGAKADWQMYGPLVASGGLIAFHDLIRHPLAPGVCDLWRELKERNVCTEIVADHSQPWGGIGVISPALHRD
jgi:predicted O-methyltransferase YrrM